MLRVPILAQIHSRESESKKQLLDEQDKAFEESLAVDREKARLQEIEEEKKRQEQQKVEEILKVRLFAHYSMLTINIQKKKQEQQKISSVVPEEPKEGEKSTLIVIRLPDGSRIQRKFRPSDVVQSLYFFVESKLPVQVEERSPFELVSNFPRKSFTQMEQTLEGAGLCPQALLFTSTK